MVRDWKLAVATPKPHLRGEREEETPTEQERFFLPLIGQAELDEVVDILQVS